MLLPRRQPAVAARVAAFRGALDAVFPMTPVPGSDDIIVAEKGSADRLVTPAAIQQQHHVGMTLRTVRDGAVTGQFNHVLMGFGIKETGPDHASTAIGISLTHRWFFGFPRGEV